MRVLTLLVLPLALLLVLGCAKKTDNEPSNKLEAQAPPARISKYEPPPPPPPPPPSGSPTTTAPKAEKPADPQLWPKPADVIPFKVNPKPAPKPEPKVEPPPEPVVKPAYKPEDPALRDQALAEIRSRGGSYEIDETGPGQPVVRVNLYGPGGRRSTLDLAKLRGLVNLQTLKLGYSVITDAHLVHLKDMVLLEELEMTYTGVTDAGLAHLKVLPKLSRLDVRATKVTDAGVKDLKRAMPGLLVLR